jgi:hypothetical protein
LRWIDPLGHSHEDTKNESGPCADINPVECAIGQGEGNILAGGPLIGSVSAILNPKFLRICILAGQAYLGKRGPVPPPPKLPEPTPIVKQVPKSNSPTSGPHK